MYHFAYHPPSTPSTPLSSHELPLILLIFCLRLLALGRSVRLFTQPQASIGAFLASGPSDPSLPAYPVLHSLPPSISYRPHALLLRFYHISFGTAFRHFPCRSTCVSLHSYFAFRPFYEFPFIIFHSPPLLCPYSFRLSHPLCSLHSYAPSFLYPMNSLSLFPSYMPHVMPHVFPALPHAFLLSPFASLPSYDSPFRSMTFPFVPYHSPFVLSSCMALYFPDGLSLHLSFL